MRLGFHNAAVMQLGGDTPKEVFQRQLSYIKKHIKKKYRMDIARHIATCHSLQHGWSYKKYKNSLKIWKQKLKGL